MKRLSCAFIWIALLSAAGALSAQTISVDQSSLTFNALVGTTPVQQTLNITSTGGNTTFTVGSNPVGGWLKFTPASGTTPSAITVTADPTNLAPGTYNGTLFIYGGTGSAVPVTVTFMVSSIAASPTLLTFTYQQGTSVPGNQPITLSGSPTSFNASASTASSAGNWLQVSPPTGTSPTTVFAVLNPAVVPTLMPGTYNGTVIITPTSGATNAPITIAVSLTVSAAPVITVTPMSLNFAVQINGSNNVLQQNITLNNPGSQPVAYGLSSRVAPNPAGTNWITLTPSFGSIPATGSTTASIGVNTTNLPAGSYSGTVTVSTPGGSPTSQTVNVNLLVSNSPLISVPSAPLTFTYQVGTAAPAAQNVIVTSTSGTIQFGVVPSYSSGTGSWISVPSTGTTGTAFAVSVNPAGLAPGSYNGTLTISAPGAANTPQQIPVTLNVTNNPVVMTSVSSLSFPYQVNQAVPSPQNVNVTSSTGAQLNYTATAASTECGNNWLILSGNTNAATNNSFTVSVNPAGIQANNTCHGTITINATVAATGASAPNSPLTIPVTLYDSANPLLVITPTAPVSFTAPVNGNTTATQYLTLTSTDPTAQLNYSVTFAPTNGGNWLFFTPQTGATAPGNTVALAATPGLLSPGTYTGTVTITATNPGGATVADSPVTIPVTFTVTGAAMAVSPTSLSFAQVAGGAAPASQTVAVTSGGTPISYTASASNSGSVTWLSVSNPSGTTPGNVTVNVDGSKLTAGTYQGTVTITATTPFTANGTIQVPVTLVVTAGTVAASPASFTFTEAQGGAAPAAQSLAIAAKDASGNAVAVNFTAAAATSTGGNWLTVSAASGATPATLQIGAAANTLTTGTYNGTITITAPGAAGSPISIPVTLNVVAPQTFTASPGNLTYAYTIGLTAPAAQAVQLTSSGGAAPFTATVQTASSTGNWLSVTPTSGTTPAALSISVNTANLAAGNYTGSIVINSPNVANQPAATINVTLTVTAIPKPVINSINNAASYGPGAISPGENVVIFGTGIGPATLAKGTVATNGQIATTAGDTTVTFDGIPAPIIYASATQTSVMVPYGLAGRTTTNVVVAYSGVLSSAVPYNVVTTAPGIYTLNQQGNGAGAILNQDFTLNSASDPAAKGKAVMIYMTGEGTTNTIPADGAIAPSNGTGLYKPLLTVTATVGGVPATVQYAGSAPGIVYGVMQVNLVIPDNAPSGANVPIIVSVGGSATQAGVTVAVQ